jgi:transketolase
MPNPISQRDSFWNRIYEIAKDDRRIVIVSSDMGAPALDRIRRDLPGQFVNVGIAEQNGILVSSGLAREGKRPFFYAIAPFAVFRPIELTRVNQSIMKIPITIVGVGAGFSYEDSGPTHHLLEDIAVVRAFPHITIHSTSDSTMAAAVAEQSCNWPVANYVRLDRLVLPDVHAGQTLDFKAGFASLRPGKQAQLVATGYMVHKALHVADLLKKDGIDLGVIDLFQLPCDADALVKQIQTAPKLFTLEEHFLPGGLGSAILEMLADRGVALPTRRFGLGDPGSYTYVYGGREVIHDSYGLSPEKIAADIRQALK